MDTGPVADLEARIVFQAAALLLALMLLAGLVALSPDPVGRPNLPTPRTGAPLDSSGSWWSLSRPAR